MRKDIKIGLFGFGCVGKGLWDVLHQTPGLKAEIVRICCKDNAKQRPISMDYFTFDKNDILSDPEINVIVELIDDADAARDIVFESLRRGKAVVTANKKMVSENMQELLKLQKKYNQPLLYEAAVCASIPIIRNLEEYYDNDLLKSIKGIVNGTTNYILTKMLKEKISYKDALQSAQDNGYAESDPSLDIDGFDAKYKLNIIQAHAFGLVQEPSEITNIGIGRINSFDANYSAEKGYKIKLVAQAIKLDDNRIVSFVMPQFIPKDHQLYFVDDVFNGILTESCFADKNFFVGKGAGAFPTASAVLSDLSALTYDYRYEYKKLSQEHGYSHSSDINLEIYLRHKNNGIDKSLFSSISEEYKSAEAGYLIGTINFEKFRNSELPYNHDYSVILKGVN